MYSFVEGDGSCGRDLTLSATESSERTDICPSETTESLSESAIVRD